MNDDDQLARHRVAPYSVHVWRGFKAANKSWQEASAFLAQVFIPAGTMLQPNAGLQAFLPAMVMQAGKPASVPDQTALMFWTTPITHAEATQTLAVRIYENLHTGAFDLQTSTSTFPVTLGSSLETDVAYYLIDRPVDWMLGQVQHLVGARRDNLTVEAFQQAAYDWAKGVQSTPPGNVDGALLVVTEDFLAAWLHASQPEAALSGYLSDLRALVTPFLDSAAEQLQVPEHLCRFPSTCGTTGRASPCRRASAPTSSCGAPPCRKAPMGTARTAPARGLPQAYQGMQADPHRHLIHEENVL